jgi:hypothetical protein
MGERTEALVRIPLLILYAIILGFWQQIMTLLAVFHLLYVLATGRRSKSIAEFANTYASYKYRVSRYLNFVSNKRPFPLTELGNPLEQSDV